jgi:hypothetical protein
MVLLWGTAVEPAGNVVRYGQETACSLFRKVDATVNYRDADGAAHQCTIRGGVAASTVDTGLQVVDVTREPWLLGIIPADGARLVMTVVRLAYVGGMTDDFVPLELVTATSWVPFRLA